jgi:hypothetical protein
VSPHADQRIRYTFAFAHILHIRPWEIDLLTKEQFDLCVAAIEEFNRKQQPEGG